MTIDREGLIAAFDLHGINVRKSFYPACVCSCGDRHTYETHSAHVASVVLALAAQEAATEVEANPTARCEFCERLIYNHDELDKHYRCGSCGSIYTEEVPNE